MKRIALAVLLTACGTVPPAPPPPPATADCPSACERGRAMLCEWAKPTTNGAACETVCENAARFVPWPTACIAIAATCAAADACQ